MCPSSVKMLGFGKFLCRTQRMRIYSTNMYHSHVSSRNHHKAVSIHSFTSFRRDHCYMQTSPCSYIPVNPHRKYHGTEEKTERSLDLLFNKGCEQLSEELEPVRKGDVINLHDLLFTKNRDYLVRYNDKEQVKAAQLAGKVIVLHFLRLNPHFLLQSDSILALEETYTYLLPDKVFEVVLVAYETNETEKDIFTIPSNSCTSYAKMFEHVFSFMPWTAIPFSDISSRKNLSSRFGVNRKWAVCDSFVIDSNGMVLHSDGDDLFENYGGLGYPFTNERIRFLKSQFVTTVMQPSLKSLLASPKREYLISNKGDKVPIDTLEGKTVALYFYEEGLSFDCSTEGIKMVYEEFGHNKSCFEVVLVYLYDTDATCLNTSEESFWNTFKSMPWLALPFKDPKCRELRRYFSYPSDPYGPEELPTLVVIGPSAKFIEPWGGKIISDFKRSAFPFTREKLAELDTEKVRELKLEMLWDPNTLFRGKHGSEVKFSQLFGKRIIVFFEGNDFQQKVPEFLMMLERRYLDMKNTSDEFEVIYITNSKNESPYIQNIAYMKWFVSVASKLLPIDCSLYRCYCHLEAPRPYSLPRRSCRGGSSSILAFDQDGKIVRKSLDLSLDCIDFPFFSGSMQEEAFSGLNNFYGWSGMDVQYQGLLINSYYRTLPAKNQAFGRTNRHQL